LQPVSTLLERTLEEQVSLEIFSRVIAEWELNSYTDTSVSSSTFSAPINFSLFPLEDIVLPRRPSKTGVPKLIVNQSRVTDDFTFPKYRVPSEEANYKYYHSRSRTDSNGQFSSPIEITIMYPEPMPCNKVAVVFETSFARPTTVELEYTLDGSSWQTTGVHNVDGEGVTNIWRQPNGTWSGVQSLAEESVIEVLGWRMKVFELTQPNAGVSIIQFSPRLTFDLTDRIIEVDIQKRREELDIISPIGTAASSSATIRLSNDDRFFDQENTDSPISKLIDRNVRFDVSDVITRTDGSGEAIPQGVFFSDEWNSDSDALSTVSATDRSKFMQETISENSFYFNRPAEVIVADVLERFGHTAYDIRYTQEDSFRRIPYVFFRDNETVWESLVSLARAEQAVFYFDEQDFFVWESRDFVWGNDTPVWSFREEADGNNLANLISFDPRFEIGANRVNIKYTPVGPATDAGVVVNNIVWEETNPLVLNASPLTQNITLSSDEISVPEDDIDFWARSGIVNIDGEYMRYEKVFDDEGDSQFLKIKERGLYDSTIQSHNINPTNNNWQFYSVEATGATTKNVRLFNSSVARHEVRDSQVFLESNQNVSRPNVNRFRQNWTTAMYLNTPANQTYDYYGAEVIIPLDRAPQAPSLTHRGQGVVGITVHNNTAGGGYYFEILPTEHASASSSAQKSEVRAWKRTSRLRGTFLGEASPETQESFPDVGVSYEIIPGRRYRLEVLHRRININTREFTFLIDGQPLINFTDTDGALRSGSWGVFCRAVSEAEFDAAWALSTPLTGSDVDALYSSFRDRVNGGFVSGLLESNWRRMNRPFASIVFEDFGPIVHGGKEFDVDYEIAPNVATDLLISNDDKIFTVFHNRDPFSSNFAIVNKTRDDIVAVGSDPSSDGANMTLAVYGRPIVEEDEKNITREDTLSRRRRGLEELELSSTWIQTEDRAERIADWFTQRWGPSNDVVEVDTVVIPQLQVGDLVDIDAPTQNLSASTHKYNITSIVKTVGRNHRMTLTLRRYR